MYIYKFLIFIFLFAIVFFVIRINNDNIQAITKINVSSPQQSTNNESSSVKPGYPVILQLKKHDKIILISSGPDCPLYSLKSDKGEYLAVDLTAEKLCARYPELKDLIENGIANWAGLDVRYQSGLGRKF